MAYVTVPDLLKYLGSTNTTSSVSTGEYETLDACVSAAQQEIDNYCRRSFEETTGTRYYRSDDLVDLPGLGGSGNVLWLGEDCLAVDALTNGDETTLTSTEYWLEPRNSSARGKPYQYIRLRTGQSWIFDTDGELNVAASWGYSSTPDDTIVQLTKETAAFLYRNRDNPVFDVTANPELGIITTPKGMPAHVKVALSQGGYRKKRIV